MFEQGAKMNEVRQKIFQDVIMQGTLQAKNNFDIEK